MPDRLHIEVLLERASETMTYPATPQLRAPVLRAIADTRRSGVAWQGGTRTLRALAVFTVAVFAVVSFVLGVPSSRDAVADFFGIEGSEVDVLPTSAPGTPETPLPTPHDIDPGALPSSLDELTTEFGRAPAIPSGQDPRELFLVRYGGSPAAILRFDTFDLWEADVAGDFEGIIGKGLPSDARLTELLVRGRQARWISGGPHRVEYIDAAGQVDEASLRTVERNTLIWRSDTALYRIETNLPLDETLQIAETLP
jgi:hypothetical protein